MGKPVLFLFLIAASVTDLNFRYIDNYQNLFYFILGLSFLTLEKGIGGFADGIFTALLSFLILYVFFAGRLLGAGDIKFIMAIGAFLGHGKVLDCVIPITVSGVIVMIIMFIREGGIKRVKIPMAVPISLGIIWKCF